MTDIIRLSKSLIIGRFVVAVFDQNDHFIDIGSVTILEQIFMLFTGSSVAKPSLNFTTRERGDICVTQCTSEEAAHVNNNGWERIARLTISNKSVDQVAFVVQQHIK